MSNWKEGDSNISSAYDRAIDGISSIGIYARRNQEFGCERLGSVIAHAEKELEILLKKTQGETEVEINPEEGIQVTSAEGLIKAISQLKKEKPLDETAIHIQQTFKEPTRIPKPKLDSEVTQ